MAKIQMDDTIAAIATPPGEGGIAVIRMSGPKSLEITEKIFVPASKKLVLDFPSHTVHFGEIVQTGEQFLDQVLVTLFRAPKSYTGETVVEISTHGGMVVTRKILDLICRKGARPAEPGEFTKRAFLNGKIDLTQAEAVLDLIKAKSERSLDMAAHQLAGSLSIRFKAIRDELLRMTAHMEAFLDFPEEDLEIFSDTHLADTFQRIGKEIRELAAGFERGALIRDGATIALIGKPNVGKSSLFNALLARDRAIVSDIPGTTRDLIEEAVEIGGFYFRLMDTAGLALQSADPVEKIGMERTRKIMDTVSLFLFVTEGSGVLDEADQHAFHLIPAGKPTLIVLNKTDLPEKISHDALQALAPGKKVIKISAQKRRGLDGLEKEIAAVFQEGRMVSTQGTVTRWRHKTALEKAGAAMAQAEKSWAQKLPLELIILDLKKSLEEMRELIGEVYHEDLLGVIFSEFCIGK